MPHGVSLGLFTTCALWSLNGYLGNLSAEKAEVSVREPVAQLQIVWGVLIGVFVFADTLTLQQFMGIFFIIMASIVLVFKKKVLEIEITKSGLHIVLIYTVLTALVASMDKYLLSFLRPELYLFFNFSIPVLFLLPFIRYNKSNLIKSIKYKKEIFILSGIFFVAYFATLYTYKSFDFSIAYPLLKVATPLTAIFAIFIFNEKINLSKKILALTMACIGAVLIKVSF
jgi:drug/metabolite transporter (DMT)-like permease